MIVGTVQTGCIQVKGVDCFNSKYPYIRFKSDIIGPPFYFKKTTFMYVRDNEVSLSQHVLKKILKKLKG